MDKITAYQNAISELLVEYQDYLGGANLNQVDNRLKTVIDTQHNHYQLLIAGWRSNKYSFNVLFHLDIIKDKIWLQQNNTEYLIADELIEKGVAREDIVLGFLPERDRAYSGFAVA
jgi:hypothetical protein